MYTMAEAHSGEHRKLICPICLQPFESPKILPCLHTFCEKCICKHAHGLSEQGKHSDTIACPVCRSPTAAPTTNQTPDDWATKLPDNSIALSHLASEQSVKDDSVYCQPCISDGQQHISIAYCVTCMEYLCQDCYKCHKKFKATKNHTITLQYIRECQSLRESADRWFRCSKHIKKYTFYCSQDKDLCCYKCATTDHRNCTGLFLIENAANNFNDIPATKDLLENLDALRKMFLTSIENRSKNLESVQQQKREITNGIDEWTIAMKDIIAKLQIAALEELDQVCKQETVLISDQIVECKSAIAALDLSERMLMEGTKLGDETRIFITNRRVSQHVKNYVFRYEATVNKFSDIKFEFKRDKNLDRLVHNLSSLGQVLSKASKLPELYSQNSFERAMMLLPRAQLETMINFSAKVPDDEATCCIYSGIFLSDDRFIVCDQGNKKLKLFDKCFHCVSYMKMTDEPRHMCSVDNQTVAVTTSGLSIVIAAVTKTLTKVRSIYVGGDCYGIASNQQNIFVHTYVNGQDSLLIYDKSYKRKTSYHLPYPLSGVFNTFCASADGQTIYYTAGDKIVTMDIGGQRLKTFESNVLKEALGVTVDTNGIVYCCGHQSQTVIQATSDGKQLNVLLRDQGLNPVGICLSEKNNMMIVFDGESDEFTMIRLI